MIFLDDLLDDFVDNLFLDDCLEEFLDDLFDECLDDFRLKNHLVGGLVQPLNLRYPH